MSRLRHHLFAIAFATLGVQALVVAIGAARVCWPGEHMHNGVPVDDCPMHHHHAAQAPASDSSHPEHHGAHAHGQPADDDGERRARLTCRCSNELPGVFTGAAGIMPAIGAVTAPLAAIADRPVVASPTSDVPFPPLSPPPRLAALLLS